MNQIINSSIASEIESHMSQFDSAINELRSTLETTINNFQKSDVAQSFVASGSVGANTADRLNSLVKVINEYYDGTVQPLKARTESYIANANAINGSN